MTRSHAGAGRWAPSSTVAGSATSQLVQWSEITRDLGEAETVPELAAMVVDHLVKASSAASGSMSLVLDSTTLALLHLRGGPRGAASRWATFPLDGDTPVALCAREGRVVALEDRRTIKSSYPDLELATEGERSLISFPLKVKDQVLGVISLSFAGVLQLGDEQVLFLELLMHACAQALDRLQARELSADREAKLHYLAEAGLTLATDLDYERTLNRVADLAVPWFADWCVIALERDGRLRNLSVAHRSPEQAPLVSELQHRFPASPEAGHGVYQVLRTGDSVLVPELTDELLVAGAQSPEHLDLLRRLDFRSALVCPLRGRTRTLGVVTWVTGADGRRFSEEDRIMGDDLARRAGAAIENAQMHTEARDVSTALQRAVLPAGLPELPSVASAVHYQQAGTTEVGGDFYDVVGLPDGRVVAFVGDVMGRGVGAAGAMAQVRATVRALAVQDPDPATVLERLDTAYTALSFPGVATLSYTLIDPSRRTVTMISAGHPPPVFLDGDTGRAFLTDLPPSLLLGAGGGKRTSHEHRLGPGDRLLLYTDGLVEVRGETLDVGFDRLLAAAEARYRPDDLDGWLSHVVAAAGDPSSDDDVTLLAVAVRPQRDPGSAGTSPPRAP